MIKMIAATGAALLFGLALGFFAATLLGDHSRKASKVTPQDWRAQVPQLRIGVTGPENAAARTGRLDKYTARLRERLGIPVTFVQASDYAGIVQAIASKQIELAIVGASAYASMYDETGGNVEPLVTNREVDGSMGYYAALFVRADSPYKSLADLKGRSIAYPDPNSTSGYLFPRAFMRQRGLDPDTYFARSGFAGGHNQTVIAVLRKQYDAGLTWTSGIGKPAEGYSRGTFRIMAQTKPPQLDTKDIRVIELLGPIPNGPTVVRKDVPQELKDLLRGILTTLHYEDRATFEALSGGEGEDYVPVPHAFYNQVIEFRNAEKAARRGK
jgi:phosphonate transport system substrate-binding protein